MVKKRMARAEGGFTLIEVMVVVLVIGVLMAIGLPMFLGAKVKAQERAAQQVLRTAQSAGLVYWAQGGTFTAFDVNCAGVPDSCDVADAEEASVSWVGPGPPAVGEVSVVVAAGNSLLVVTRATSEDHFCIAQSSGQSERGRGAAFGDVDTIVECAGGW